MRSPHALEKDEAVVQLNSAADCSNGQWSRPLKKALKSILSGIKSASRLGYGAQKTERLKLLTLPHSFVNCVPQGDQASFSEYGQNYFSSANTKNLTHYFKKNFKNEFCQSVLNRQGLIIVLPQLSGQQKSTFVEQIEQLVGKSQEKRATLSLPSHLSLISFSNQEGQANSAATNRQFKTENWALTLFDAETQAAHCVPVTFVQCISADCWPGRSQIDSIRYAQAQHYERIEPAYATSTERPLIIANKASLLAAYAIVLEETCIMIAGGKLTSTQQALDYLLDQAEQFPDQAELIRMAQDVPTKRLLSDELDKAEHIYFKRIAPQRVFRARSLRCLSTRRVDAGTHTLNKQPYSPSQGPLAMPWLHAQGIAYKQKNRVMQCALNAVNAFFQAPVASEVDLATFWAKHLVALVHESKLEMNGLTSLYILKAIARQRSVNVDRQWFIAGDPDSINPICHQSAVLQWQHLVALAELENRYPCPSYQQHTMTQVALTPSMWFSAMSGFPFDLLESAFKWYLRAIKSQITSPSMAAKWAHLPDDFVTVRRDYNGQFDLSSGLGMSFGEQIKQLQTLSAQQGKSLGMVLITGLSHEGRSSSAGVNHYFTIMYQPQTDLWLNFNADSAQTDGVQTVKVFSPAYSLEAALNDARIQEILLPMHILVSGEHLFWNAVNSDSGAA